MRFYSEVEIAGMQERLGELRKMRDSNYQGMSCKRELPRIVELNFLELILRNRKNIKW